MSIRKNLFRLLIIIVPLALGIIFSVYMNQGSGSLEGVSATVLSDGKALPKFVLEDHHGQAFTNDNLKGQWSFVFFGYTHCPDICPTTLSLLNQINQALKKEADIDIPKTIFISIDPERDTVAQLAEYVPYFNSEFIGVTGSKENLLALTDPLGIAFGKEGDTKSDEYEMYHGARILLIDPKIRLKALFSYPHDVKTIVSDYSKIIGS